MIKRKKIKNKDIVKCFDNFKLEVIKNNDVIKTIQNIKIKNIVLKEFANLCTEMENIKGDLISTENISTFLNKFSLFLKNHKKILEQLHIHNKIVKLYLDFCIFIQGSSTSLLTSTLNINIKCSDILNEINKCLNIEILFYSLHSELETITINSKEKVNHIFNILKELKYVISTVDKNIETNKTDKMDITIDHLQIVDNLIKTTLKKIKINTYVTSVFNWDTISKKICEYIYNTRPFSLLNIRKTDTPIMIVTEILKLLINDSNKYQNKIDQFFQKSNNERNDKNIKNAHICDKIFIGLLTTKSLIINQIKESNNALKMLKNNKLLNKEFDIIQNLNNYIYCHYNKIISVNEDLNISDLQNLNTCNNYKSTFIFETKWFDICENVRKYLFFKYPKNFNARHKFKSIKCSLKSVVVDSKILEKINKIVIDVNEIVTRTYQFIKLYVLSKFESHQPLPDVTDIDFINMIVRASVINDQRGNNVNDNNKIILKELENFYDSNLKNIYKEKCNAIGYSNILNFCKQEILTAYTNNIKMNYLKYVKQYLFSYFYSLNRDKILNKSDKKELRKQVAMIINDICSDNFENTKCEKIYRALFLKIKNKIFPSDAFDKGIENDIDSNPNKYFYYMIFMNYELEQKQMKMFNCFPLRTSIVPSSISINTLSVITLFTKAEDGQGISKLLKDNISIFYDKIWKLILNIDGNQFKWNDRYKFNHTISTDGVNVTILMVDKNLDGIEFKTEKQKDYYKYIDSLGKDGDNWDCELMKKEMKKLMTLYNLVLVDPGKNPDILHMCNYVDENENNEEVKYFRYTTKQRLHELGTIKNRKTSMKFKNSNKEIRKEEQKLRDYSSKTCSLNKFKEYVKLKQEINKKLKPYYNMEFIRKLTLRSYYNKLRSESKLVNNIKRIYGSNKKEIMLVYGDWSRTDQMRGVISTPMIGIKRRLNQDFKIMNINEFRTSCLDNKTFKKNKEAFVKKYGKPIKKLHSVLVSEIPEKSGCKGLLRFQNRNRNASKNMSTILDHYVKNGERHPKFSRKTKIEE